jgi:hypothetical protein
MIVAAALDDNILIAAESIIAGAALGDALVRLTNSNKQLTPTSRKLVPDRVGMSSTWRVITEIGRWQHCGNSWCERITVSYRKM